MYKFISLFDNTDIWEHSVYIVRFKICVQDNVQEQLILRVCFCFAIQSCDSW